VNGLKTTCIIAMMCAPAMSRAQERVALSGHVEERTSGERLVNATLHGAGGGAIAITNAYGFFSAMLPAGEHCLVARHAGFSPDTLRVSLKRDTSVCFRLVSSTFLREVTVRPARPSVTLPATGRHVVSMEQTRAMPALLGEVDILKALQQLPGVNGGTEGSSAFSVRGSGPGETLVLLDGMPVYNANHAFGYLSAFNGEALKGATLYKGDAPARHGGRLSSVLDATMKEGNARRLSGSATLGPLAGAIALEGPIKKGKASFILSGRRAWLDVLLRAGQALSGSNLEMLYRFHDLNGKVNWKIDGRHHLFLSFYNGRDRFGARWNSAGLPGRYAYSWGNASVAGRWTWIIAPRLFHNATLYYSRFDYENESRQRRAGSNEDDATRFYSNLDDATLKSDFDLVAGEHRRTRFGLSLSRRRVAPEMTRQSVGGVSNAWRDAGSGPSREAAIYVEREQQLGERWRVNAGARATLFAAGGARYTFLEPRLSLSCSLSPRASVKAAFAMMHQPLHLLSNSSLDWKTDMWASSGDAIKPARARHYIVGFYREGGDSGIDLSVEVYRSRLERVVRYDEGVLYLKHKDDSWQEHARVGEGWASGMEIMLNKPAGQLNGWIAYTLSRAERRFPDVAGGERFPFEYDRRHKLNAVAQYVLSRRTAGRFRRVLAANFTLASGNRVTIGEEAYPAAPLPGGEASWTYAWWGSREYIPRPNNARLPLYHHLDVAFHLQNRQERGSSWSFGAYNVYARKNPGFYYRKMEGETFRYKQVSILPFVPFLSWHYKF
jgi:hypothetical protein